MGDALGQVKFQIPVVTVGAPDTNRDLQTTVAHGGHADEGSRCFLHAVLPGDHLPDQFLDLFRICIQRHPEAKIQPAVLLP